MKRATKIWFDDGQTEEDGIWLEVKDPSCRELHPLNSLRKVVRSHKKNSVLAEPCISCKHSE